MEPTLLSPENEFLNSKETEMKPKEIPVSTEMLHQFRNEVRSEITGLKIKIESLETRLDRHIAEIKALIHEQNLKLDARLEEFKTMIHRQNMIIEEQNNKFNYLVDQLSLQDNKLDRHDQFHQEHSQQFLDHKKMFELLIARFERLESA